jgi:hypothetical protein
MPGDDSANSRSENIDSDADDIDYSVGKQVCNRVDSDMAIFAAGSDSSHHREPEHDQANKPICPNDACIEYLAKYDLANGEQHQTAQQSNERYILKKATKAVESIKIDSQAGCHA